MPHFVSAGRDIGCDGDRELIGNFGRGGMEVVDCRHLRLRGDAWMREDELFAVVEVDPGNRHVDARPLLSTGRIDGIQRGCGQLTPGTNSCQAAESKRQSKSVKLISAQ